MPIYTLRDDAGAEYDIEAPDGTPERNLIAAVQQHKTRAQNQANQDQVARAKQALEEANKPTPETGFLASAKRGYYQTKGLLGDVLPAMVARGVGADEYADKQFKEYADTQKMIGERFPQEMPSYKDIKGVGDAFTYVKESIGENLASIIPSLFTGGISAIAGRGAVAAATTAAEQYAAKTMAQAAAKNVLTQETLEGIKKGALDVGMREAQKIALKYQAAGAVAGSALQNIPEVYQGVKESTGKESLGTALVAGGFNALLDAILPFNLLRQVTATGIPKEKIVGAWLSRFGKGTAIGAATEGSTEAVQEMSSAAAEKFVDNNKQFFTQENLERFLNAGLKGGIGGGVISGTTDALTGRKTAPPTPEAEPVPGQRFPDMSPQGPYMQKDLFEEDLANRRQEMDQTQGPPTPPAAPEVQPPAQPPAQGDFFPDAATDTRQADLFSGDFSAALDRRQQELEQAIAATPVAQPGQQEIPLVGGRTATQQNIEGIAGEKNEQAVNAAQEGEAIRVAEAKKKQAVAQQKLDFEIANVDNLIHTNQLDQVEQTRLALLLPIIESRTGYMAGAFHKALKQAGWLTLRFTPREATLIQRANDVRAAIADEEDAFKVSQWAAYGTPNLPASPNEMSAEQMGIPERQEKGPAGDVPRPLAPARMVSARTTSGIVPSTPNEMSAEQMGIPERQEKGPAGDVPRPLAPARMVPSKTAPAPVVAEQPAPAAPAIQPAKMKAAPAAPAVQPAKMKAAAKTEQIVSSVTAALPVIAEPPAQALPSKVKAAPIEPIKPGTPAPAPTFKNEVPVRTTKKAQAPAAAPAVQPAKMKVPAPAKPAKEKTSEEKSSVSEKKEARVETKPEEDTSPLTKFTDAISRAYTAFSRKEKGTVEDVAAVKRLIAARGNLTSDAKAAQNYFNKLPRVIDNLHNIAFDLAFQTDQFRQGAESSEEAAFFSGMNGKKAQPAFNWVMANLSAEAKLATYEYVRKYKAELLASPQSDEAITERVDRLRAVKTPTHRAADVQDYITANSGVRLGVTRVVKGRAPKETLISFNGFDRPTGLFDATEATPFVVDVDSVADEDPTDDDLRSVLPLLSDAVGHAALPLHPAIQGLLSIGNLLGALRSIAGSSTAVTSKLASTLLQRGLVADTKVVVKDNLTDPDGRAVPGYFDPNTNTVYLDSVAGMNEHVLLHELGHAVTSHVIDNPSHPLTKQLQQLFNDVKDSLDTAYGAQDLHEFVAESWSNNSFRAKLNSINPKGGKITAWQRFTNAVLNFFRSIMGMDTRSIETALSASDKLVEAIMAPAPKSRGANFLYAATVNPKDPAVVSWFNKIASTLEKLPGMSETRTNKIHEFLRGTTSKTIKNTVYSALPLDSLVDVAKKELPRAGQVNTLVQEKSGNQNQRDERLDAQINKNDEWAKQQTTDTIDTFDNLVTEASRLQVDPFKPRSAYEADPAKKRKANDEKLTIWDDMQAAVAKIGREGVVIAKQIFGSYLAMHEETVASLLSQVDSMDATPEAKTKIKTEIYAKLAEQGRIEPYVPFTRKGDYWLSYPIRDAKGQKEYVITTFEEFRARELKMEELKAAGVAADEMQAFSKISEYSYRNAPANSFVNGILQIMTANKIDNDVQEQVLRLFLSTLPETSFAQAFQKRKNILGYNQDVIGVFRQTAKNMSRQLSNMIYASKFIALEKELKDDIKALGAAGKTKDNELAAEYYEELSKRIKFAISPTSSRAVGVLSSLGFIYLMGFNISSAVVNLAQVPLIVLPYLGGKYGFPESAKAMSHAYKLFANSGFTHSSTLLAKDANGKDIKVTGKAMPSMANVESWSKDEAHMQTLVDEAKRRGQLNRSAILDMLEVDSSNNPLQVFNKTAGIFFHHGERMNREVTLIMSYNLELDRLNSSKATDAEKAMSPKERELSAANEAILATERTNGGSTAASAPSLTQSGIGKVLFMFKRYGASMYYMLYKTAKEALKNEDPKVRAAALKQMAGIYGMAAIFAGIQGLPLFGILSMVYNMMSDDDDEDDLASLTRKHMGELAYKGLINQLTGIDIAARTGIGDLLFRDNRTSSNSQDLANTIGETFGGPIFGIATRVKRGFDQIRDGHAERGIENIVPSAISNAMKSYRYATEGTNTLRGDPIVGDVGPWNAFAQAFGFSPAEYTKQLEINAREKGIDKKVASDKKKFLDRYYFTTRMGDADGRAEAMQGLRELNAKHPGLRISMDTIDRSMAAHMKQTQKMYHGIALSTGMRAELLRDAAELE